MVPPVSHGVSRVPRYSGFSLIKFAFRLRGSHPLWQALPDLSTKQFLTWWLSATPKNKSFGLASSAFARHYLRNLCWFLFLALLRCFSSGGSPHTPMYSTHDDKTFLLPDCSIRKSTDISLTYSSPWLIAVSHVLHRLSVPRHSPCALCSLTILLFGVELIHLLMNFYSAEIQFIFVLRCGAARFHSEALMISHWMFSLRDYEISLVLSLSNLSITSQINKPLSSH